MATKQTPNDVSTMEISKRRRLSLSRDLDESPADRGDWYGF
ncbi:MAG TPA: hypothetical protein VMY37_10720 [Thermoguttaceae bacterium]|nr:hypothetical protein [Thermoguttaceae bacterium]